MFTRLVKKTSSKDLVEFTMVEYRGKIKTHKLLDLKHYLWEYM